ncbi:Coenzyme F420 hydrogenase/dehydrogenase, beta subunit C-terminal domain [Paraeggerthella sp.]|uniref:Coenzyme F420 hydrogenase/dehydrogenase, beta subunit C-terminal domain n=1 Tax=Paraeggerthella sp. TaxID=2897350 RepID=UPI0035291A09
MSDKANGLIACDLVCLDVPSPKGFRSYVEWLEACTGKRVVGYRHRGHTPRGLYEERAVYDDGSFEEATVRTRAWKRVWNKMMLRPSCLECAYHSVVRPGDLSMGDYWGVERAHPGIADDRGVSCLFANTANGLRFLKGASHSLNLVDSSPSLCANPEQPMLCHPPQASRLHDGFWEALVEDGFGAACESVGVLGARRSLKDAVLPVLRSRGGRKGVRRRGGHRNGCDYRS